MGLTPLHESEEGTKAEEAYQLGGRTVAQYTPGPWRIEERGEYFDIYIMAGEVDIIELALVDANLEANIANAQLIAAAPELEQALDILLSAMQWLCANASLTDGERQSLEAPCEYARAAIKKAESRSA